jgi:hypothetical protein
LFRVMLVRFRVRVAEGKGSVSPVLPSGWEPSEEEALPPAEPLPLGSEPSGWLELEPPPELPPGSEEEAPPFLPPQAARDRTMAAARTAVKIRLFIVSKLLFMMVENRPSIGSCGV